MGNRIISRKLKRDFREMQQKARASRTPPVLLAMRQFWKGKKQYNREIIRLLLKRGSQSRREIARELHVRRATVYDRIKALYNLGVVGIDYDAAGDGRKVAKWELTSSGIWAATYDEELRQEILPRYSNIARENWLVFSELYGLDQVDPGWPAHYAITEWLGTIDGTQHLIDMFGSQMFSSQEICLTCFRRMVDLALLKLHGAWFPLLPIYGEERVQNPRDWYLLGGSAVPYGALIALAVNDKILGRLDLVLKETDAPIRDYVRRPVYDAFLRIFRKYLGEEVAKKLADIPLIKDQRRIDGTAALIHLSKDAFYYTGVQIKIEENRVRIETDDPDRISPEWKVHCDVLITKGRSRYEMKSPPMTGRARSKRRKK